MIYKALTSIKNQGA